MSTPDEPTKTNSPPEIGSTRDFPPGDPTADAPEANANTLPLPGAPPRSASMPLPGRYLLSEQIARGGMGEVFRATDTVLGREVAVKVLHEKFTAESHAARRFLFEAQITGRLQHPAIPPVHDLGALADGRPYLAMKLIQGRTLARELADRPDPTQDRVRFVAVFAQVCQAMAYAHAQGIIHRDLKPLNVMVGAFGEVQVMDWGLAKSLGDDVTTQSDEPVSPSEATINESVMDRTRAGSIIGTPGYMPPEQANGEIHLVDRRSDVFALGALLCEVLTGIPPYGRDSTDVLLSRAMAGELDPAFTLLQGCGADPELITLCRRCLSINPAQRPKDAGEVASAVAEHQSAAEERLRQAELDRVRSETERAAAAEKAAVERKKRRAQLALAGAMVLLVSLGGIGAWWGQKQIDERKRLEANQVTERAIAAAENLARRERVQANARDAIERAAAFRAQWHWDQAEKLLAQAAGQLGPDDDPDLIAEVAAARRDTTFLARLFAIRMAKAGTDGKYHNEDAPPAYVAAFKEYGYDFLRDDPAVIAKRLKASPVWSELLVALDDWAWTASIVAGMQAQGERVWEVTTLATGRSNRPGRATNDLKNPAAILKFMESLPDAELTPSLVSHLAGRMQQLGGDHATVFEAGIRRHPTDFWMHFELGWAYWFGKPRRLDLAVGQFRASVALRPNVPLARSFLAEAMAEQAKSKGQVPESEVIAKLRERANANPRDIEVRRELGYRLYLLSRFAEAVEVFRELIHLEPDVADHHHWLGEMYRWGNRHQEAIAPHREAVRLAPDRAHFVGRLGEVLSVTGDHDEGIRLLRESTKLSSNRDPRFFSVLGDACERAGQISEAVDAYGNAVRYYTFSVYDWKRLAQVSYKARDYNTAAVAAQELIRLEPEVSLNYNWLALALEGKGDILGTVAAHRKEGQLCRVSKDYDRSIICFRLALALTSRDATLHHEIALSCLEKGDLIEADKAAQEALRIDPNLAAAHATRGWIANRQHRNSDALAEFQTALRIEPGDSKSLYGQSMSCFNLRKYDDAEYACRTILRRDPNIEYAQQFLATILMTKGDYEGSILAYKETIRINPRLRDVYLNLARAYRLIGRLPEAVAVIRKGLEFFANDASLKVNLDLYQRLLDTEHALSAVLAGSKKVSDADLLAYAQFCIDAHIDNYATVFHIYIVVQDHLNFIHRYNAASAAILFAAGHDKSVPNVTLDEWQYLMARARAFFAATEKELRTMLISIDPQTQTIARNHLRRFLRDPNLAPVRDPDQLRLMPDPEERAAWEKFWEDLRETVDSFDPPKREQAPPPREKK